MTEESRKKPTDDRHPDDDDEVDFSSFWEYVQSEKGHQVVERVLTMIDDVKKATLAQRGSFAKFEKMLQYVLMLAVIGVAAWLSIQEKFTTPMGILLGTLVGYAYGRRH